jgi:hypothetical protein
MPLRGKFQINYLLILVKIFLKINHPVSTLPGKPLVVSPHYLSAAYASYLLFVFPVVYAYG